MTTSSARPHLSNVDLVARRAFRDAIEIQLMCAYAKHGSESWSRHEFYGILKEEVEELWDAIKRDAPQSELFAELIQVASVCFRYAETPDRYRGQQPSADDVPIAGMERESGEHS